MHYGGNPVFFKTARQVRGLGQAALKELPPARQPPVPGGKVVKDHGLIPGGVKQFVSVRPNIPCAADNKNVFYPHIMLS